jgi:CBS-domain-containing membrane protein
MTLGPIDSLEAVDIMNPAPMVASASEDFWSLMTKMQTNGLMHTVVPIVDEGHYVGLVRTQDVLFR